MVNNPASTSDIEKLNSEQDYILNKKGTEAPFSSFLYKETRPGRYLAADTKLPVFRSEQKYESGTGWPSFWAPISPEAIITKIDVTLGLERTEVLSTAGGHLGHVFPDGPKPTGLRYCMNGDALIFVPDNKEK
ncbi:MAG TPA: peptide-methionine (R)-S-oxide reductase MsrB [bacterium]|nr:peptide-methionine (R)-S-oxide reductase MsrB [bacterium]